MSVTTRTLIFIEAENQAIGLLCFIAVGMAEVPSYKVSVKVGDRVRKGDETGMFQTEGSSHCLVFRLEAKIAFAPEVHRALREQ